MTPRRPAFTIIELMITISIIAILIAAATIGISHARASGRDTQRINDILSLGQVIDQSAAAHGGVYPVGANPLQTTNEIYADTIDPTNLDVALFKSNTLPFDPSYPSVASRSGCTTSFVCGYIYDNRASTGSSLAKSLTGPSAGQYEYILQVGLETDRFSDDQSLIAGPAGTQSGRTQYLFLGKYCGATQATDTCSIP